MQLNAAVVDRAPTADENRVLHQTIQAVTDDIDKLSFNTAIARMMEFTNYFTTASERPREALEKFVLLLSPFAPHIAEELWQALGHAESLAHEPWPEFDPALAKEDYGRSAGADQRQGAVENHGCPPTPMLPHSKRLPAPIERVAELARRKTGCESDCGARPVG